MKKFNNKKSVIEKGGLMIEALAMLGLIAVVTPTMYKKSAERTMEVEDINTASSIRTYMNGLNSLLSANYIEIMEQIEEDDETPKDIKTLKITVGDTQTEADKELPKYLPAGYNAEKDLYNYGTPTFYVVRKGNNLTGIMTFPSKTDNEDDSIGQERTVRIASLIGSNGGYVRGDKARGVGGTWTFDKGTIGSPKDYSIVTSSADVVSSSTSGQGGDNTKYLQRTNENDETWRNTMRTDIYMGEASNPGEDYDDKDTNGFFSIRNINQLIVGTEEAQDKTSSSGTSVAKNTYGLYINEEIANTGNEKHDHGINAYIAGSLMAAADKFFTDENELSYDGPKIQLGKGGSDDYLIFGTAKTAAAEEGQPATGDNRVEIIKDKIVVSDGDITDVAVTNVSGTNVLMVKDGFKGAEVEGKTSLNTDIQPAYASEHTFPVMVDSNMMVNGLLAAGQVDAQHIRSASLSTGSQNIDDKIKWMDVDNDGIHIRNRDGATPKEGDDTKAKSAKSQVEINKDVIAMRFDSGVEAVAADGALTAHGTQFIMDNEGVGLFVHNNGSNKRDTNDDKIARSIQVATDEMGMELALNEMTVGGSVGINNTAGQYRVKYQNGGHVDMAGTTLQVTDKDAKPVLTIQGNDDQEDGFSGTNYNDPSVKFDSDGKRENTSFKIAGHGNTVFTSDAVEQGDDKHATKFLAMGVDTVNDNTDMNKNQYNAAVNIVGNSGTAANNQKAQRVLYIDLDDTHTRSFTNETRAGTAATDFAYKLTNTSTASTSKTDTYMPEGSIYVRKGLIDIAPKSADVPGSGAQGDWTADEASGTVRASRFVANNVDTGGNRVKYTNPVRGASDHSSVYKEYNGSSKNPYDTYMVNPAYTSVMKDIKLTSRLGARLSDILPDFIVKAIYISRNVYDEQNHKTKDLVFSDWDSADASSWTEGEHWASPYLGRVMAPQCPPGYGRVITVVPQEFKMAQVGNLITPETLGSDNAVYAGSGYTVMDEYRNSHGDFLCAIGSSALSSSSGTNHERRKEALNNQAEYKELVLSRGQDTESASIKFTSGALTHPSGVNSQSDIDTWRQKLEEPLSDGESNNVLTTTAGTTNYYSDGISGNNNNLTTVTAVDMGQKELRVETFNNMQIGIKPANATDDNMDLRNNTISKAYVLTSTNAKTAFPITFQQSTWLKATTQTLKPAGKSYMQGWAVLMGFIYPYDIYKDVVKNLDEVNANASEKLEAIRGKDNKLLHYWNVFPIRVGTLEAQITTYCYFDNKLASSGKHLMKDPVTGLEDTYWWTSTSKQYDSFEYGYSEKHEGYAPTGNAADYRKSLNDPALKYDELW